MSASSACKYLIIPFGSLDLRLVIFHDVIRNDPGEAGRGYSRVAGISVFFGRLGSAVVSSDPGALGEAESETAFLRDFLAGAGDALSLASLSLSLSLSSLLTPFFGVLDGVDSVAFRFDLVDVEALVTGSILSVLEAALVVLRLEERRTPFDEAVAGAILLKEEAAKRAWCPEKRAVRMDGRREGVSLDPACTSRPSMPKGCGLLKKQSVKGLT